jgi:hypothetical protein
MSNKGDKNHSKITKLTAVCRGKNYTSCNDEAREILDVANSIDDYRYKTVKNFKAVMDDWCVPGTIITSQHRPLMKVSCSKTTCNLEWNSHYHHFRRVSSMLKDWYVPVLLGFGIDEKKILIDKVAEHRIYGRDIIRAISESHIETSQTLTRYAFDKWNVKEHDSEAHVDDNNYFVWTCRVGNSVHSHQTTLSGFLEWKYRGQCCANTDHYSLKGASQGLVAFQQELVRTVERLNSDNKRLREDNDKLIAELGNEKAKNARREVVQ